MKNPSRPKEYQVAPLSLEDLLKLGQKLSTEGPYKSESTPRRIRGELGGVYIFDTLQAVYVWEHKRYPYFYIPLSEIKKGVIERIGDEKAGFYHAKAVAGNEEINDVLVFKTPSSLENLVRISHPSLSWFSEDILLLGPHPKDPYKRIETLSSSRNIRIQILGVTIADSSQNVFLYETGLRPRYYLSAVNVRRDVLVESETESFCPYKGMANYYHIHLNGKEYKDVVWYYKYPTAESAEVAGRLCFYNEKVDVFVDGVKEDK